MLPGDAGRVGDPVLLAARIAAGGLAFVEQCRAGGFGARLQRAQLGRVVGLQAQVVDAQRRATILGKYRQGQTTSSARDDQATGTVSRAIN